MSPVDGNRDDESGEDGHYRLAPSPDRPWEPWERQEIRHHWPILKKISANYTFVSRLIRLAAWIGGVVLTIGAAHQLISRILLAIIGP